MFSLWLAAIKKAAAICNFSSISAEVKALAIEATKQRNTFDAGQAFSPRLVHLFRPERLERAARLRARSLDRRVAPRPRPRDRAGLFRLHADRRHAEHPGRLQRQHGNLSEARHHGAEA